MSETFIFNNYIDDTYKISYVYSNGEFCKFTNNNERIEIHKYIINTIPSVILSMKSQHPSDINNYENMIITISFPSDQFKLISGKTIPTQYSIKVANINYSWQFDYQNSVRVNGTQRRSIFLLP